jgi:RecA-family ATPase
MRVVTADQYMKIDRPEPTWLIDGFLPTGAMALLIGEPKAGKSFFALQLCEALANGKLFLGRKTRPNSKVLYINLDAPDSSWNDRLRQLAGDGFVLGPNVAMVHPEDVIRPCNIMAMNVQRAFSDAIIAYKPDLIVVDVLRELHNQKEESSSEMKVIVDTLLHMTKDAAVIGIHHTVKISNKEDIRIVDLVRGSSYLAGKAETIWCLMDNTLHTTPRFAEKQALHGSRNGGLWVLPDLDAGTIV